MEVVTQALFDDAFPHGAAVFFSENKPVSDLLDLEVRESEGSVYVRGWSYPNKDYIFDLTKVTETDNGWWVKTIDGEKAFLSPLSPQREAQARSLLNEES